MSRVISPVTDTRLFVKLKKKQRTAGGDDTKSEGGIN